MDKMYSVATGGIDPLKSKSRKAAVYMKKQKGFLGLAPTPPGETRLLWMYDSLNNAKLARNAAQSVGIHTGNNIVEFTLDPDGFYKPGEVVG